VYFLF
jgi:catechol 1,2-dioxygenase